MITQKQSSCSTPVPRFIAPQLRLERRLKDPNSFVLPLHYRGIFILRVLSLHKTLFPLLNNKGRICHENSTRLAHQNFHDPNNILQPFFRQIYQKTNIEDEKPNPYLYLQSSKVTPNIRIFGNKDIIMTASLVKYPHSVLLYLCEYRSCLAAFISIRRRNLTINLSRSVIFLCFLIITNIFVKIINRFMVNPFSFVKMISQDWIFPVNLKV